MPPRQPELAITNATGKVIGHIRQVHLGKHKRVFWDARALDGCDLGAHVSRVETEWAIRDDNDAGRPRSPSQPAERYRPVYNSAEKPTYLGTL